MNPKVLNRPNQADKAKGKKVMIDEESPTNSYKVTKVSPEKTPRSTLETSALGAR